MKKSSVVIVAVVGIVLFGIVFGFDGIKGFIGGSKEVVKKSINKNTSTTFDVGRIVSLMKSEGGKISDFEGELNDLRAKISGEEKKVVKLEKEKADQLKALKIAKGLLEQKKDEYVIADQKYTYAQVESNASWRIGYVKTLDSRIEMSKTLISSLDITHKNCMASLLEAKTGLGKKQGELEKLQAREMNAEIKARANALSMSLNGLSDSLLASSALEEAFKNYESKVTKKEFSLNGINKPIETVAIPYDVSSTKKEQDTVAKIDDVLAE